MVSRKFQQGLPYLALLLILFSLPSIIESGVRNMAFAELLKSVLSPSLTFDRTFLLSCRLLDWLTERDARYEKHQVRTARLAERLKDYGKLVSGASHGVGASGRLPSERHLAYALNEIALEGADVTSRSVERPAKLLERKVEADGSRPLLYTDTAGPSSFVVPSVEFPGFQLAAIYVEQESVALGGVVPMVIVWRVSDGFEGAEEWPQSPPQSEAGWTARRSGRFLFQIGAATNELTDGGFERTFLPRPGPPVSLPRPLYVRQTRRHVQLLYESPEDAQTMVLRLDGLGETSVGLGSRPLEVSHAARGGVYVVTGRYRTTGDAVPRIGVRWLLWNAKQWDDNVSSYVVQRPSEDWVTFAGILTIHPETRSLQYWVLNANPDSQLYVDNVGVFLIPLPSSITSPD